MGMLGAPQQKRKEEEEEKTLSKTYKQTKIMTLFIDIYHPRQDKRKQATIKKLQELNQNKQNKNQSTKLFSLYL